MTDIKYSTCRAAYNRYMRNVNFFSWYGLTLMLFPILAAVGGGMWEHNLRNAFCIGSLVLASLLAVYTIIGGCIIGDAISFTEFADIYSRKQTEKAFRKNKKWLI